MAQAAKAQEPTMEEILASIRRIIADDDGSKAGAASAKPAPAAAAQAAAPAAADSSAMGQDDIDAMLAGMDDAAPEMPAPTAAAEPDVLELTEAMAAPEAPTFKRIEAAPDIDFAEDAPPPPPSPPRPAPPRVQAQVEPLAAPLMSQQASAAVDAAFHSLAHTVLVQNATTLEDLVKEMLRPLLKTWLDDNLPTLVERLVRAEIERVSRGRT